MTAPPITVSVAGHIRPGAVGEGPGRSGGPEPGAGGLEAPGFTPPGRPQLDLSCSAAGIAGLVVSPDSPVRLGVVFRAAGAATIPLPVAARAVAAAEDGGLWVLVDEAILAVDRQGRVRAELGGPAVRLVGSLATPGAVWALGADSASFVAPDGSVVRHATPWLDPVAAAAAGDSLVARDGDIRGEIIVLSPDGTVARRSTETAAEPFERLLAYDPATSLWGSLHTLRRDGPGGGTLEVVGCGLGPEGAFLAARTGGDTWLWTSGAHGAPLGVAHGERVLAVTGDEALVAGRTTARWINRFDGATVTDPITLSPRSYERSVRPFAWEMPTGYGTAASSPHRVALAAAGPTGLVAIIVNWP